MIMTLDINTNLSIHSLKDLIKLKPFMEDGKMKINKSQIARELGKDRRTIDKYINGFEKKTTRKKSSSIDAYHEIITDLLSGNGKQVFYYKSILWQYLVDNHGLNCAESSFRRYIQCNKEFQSYFDTKSRRKPLQKAHIRFETPPAKQAQLDWKESIPFTLKNGETIDVNVLVLLLSFSRYRVYHLSLSKSQNVLFSLLDRSFELFGGVPSELLTDNMKTVMDEARTKYRKGKINNRFLQFADDYGFKVKPCIAARPQTKAKVESPMKVLDEIRAYNGTLDYVELNELVVRINNRVNAKYNQGTGKIPILHFEKEKTFLSPLPHKNIRKSYQINTINAKVNSSSMIYYQKNQYSVGPEFIGKTVYLQVHDNHIYVYYNTTLIAMHQLSNCRLNYHEQHYFELASKTNSFKEENIKHFAKENLKMIGAMYQDE